MTAGGSEPIQPREPGLGSTADWSPAGADLELRRVAASIYERLFQRPSAPVRLGRYTLLERLGEGGMGVVYAAYDAQLDRKVAVKIQRILPDDAPERGERLLREALALARLSHPNIVAVFDAGEVEGQVYVAMEFIRGMTLKTWLAEQPRSWQQILAALLQAGQGLAAAHGAGITHRDFKPKTRSLLGRPPFSPSGRILRNRGVSRQGPWRVVPLDAAGLATGWQRFRAARPCAPIWADTDERQRARFS